MTVDWNASLCSTCSMYLTTLGNAPMSMRKNSWPYLMYDATATSATESSEPRSHASVSYTHLTLPTIYSV